MQIEKSITFWSEVKDIFKQISEKFDTVWQKRKRVLSTQLLVTFILKLVQKGIINIYVGMWHKAVEQYI